MSEKISSRPSTGKVRGYSINAKRAHRRGYSHCFRCGKGWNQVEGHVTDYRKGHGCFPLCEGCWGSLTPDERVPYYEELLWSWHDMDCAPEPDVALDIIAAVIAGG